VSQLPLMAGADSALGEEFLRILRLVVARIGLKQASSDLNCTAAFLSSALSGKGTNHLRASWVPWLLRNDISGEAVRFLASCCGLTCEPVRKLTPEERLERLERAIAKNLGAPMQAALMAEVERGDR
jgi:hypothetical protein